MERLRKRGGRERRRTVKRGGKSEEGVKKDGETVKKRGPVSYTHLTLPTTRMV